MKRLASFAVALALVVAFAPRAEAQEVRLGLTGGATTTSVGGSSVTLGNWKWGGMAGAFGQYFLARQTYIGLDEAPERGWTVISMKNDWSKIFPSPDLP